MLKTSVLIIDDSPTMRAVIKTVLSRDPAIEVIGEAGDAYEARNLIKSLNPDVLTLDIEMPRMSGLQFLEKIMTLRPMPVIMLSSLTKRGAVDTVEALTIGAFDCVAKPTSGDYIAALAHLPALVKAAGKYHPEKTSKIVKEKTVSHDFYKDNSIIAIGSSTGGVDALLQVLSDFPINCPPTVITQHMPETFLTTFAARLNNTVAPKVSLAYDGARLEAGQVYIAPGGEHHLQVKGRSRYTCHLLAEGRVSGHRPSVDVLFNSLAQGAGKKAVGVMLTGMGRDGAQGLLAMRQSGARTLGQDPKSCVVYGMPKAAFELGAVEKQVPLSLMGRKIISLCRKEQGVLQCA